MTKPKRGNPPWRSKLLPYAPQIARWGRDGRTYREMAELLRIEHGVTAHPDTINSFVLVRSRGSRRAILPRDYLHLGAEGKMAKESPLITHAAGEATPAQPAKSVTLKPVPASKVLGTDGKQISGAQYAPANPADL